MLNTHYFTSNAHDGLFNRIKLETENIGYYNQPGVESSKKILINKLMSQK